MDLRDTWRQPKRLTVSEWADEHRVLDERFASEPGRWHTDRAPYAREWMDSAALSWVRRVTICASTQVGKTESANNIVGFYAHQKPSPMMIVMPNADAARLSGERRIMPMVRASDALRGELTARAHDAKNREIAFRRSILYLRSAQSPVELASVPVRLVLGDETDKWPKWSGREASPLALVTERTRTFFDSVVVLTSTPTTRHGLIHREFLLGDQRRYHVPCPHCGVFQVFEWKRVTWDRERVRSGNEMRLARDAWYVCASCTGKIEDKHKRECVARGVWVPHGFTAAEWTANDGARARSDRNEHRSYHLWAAYSPWVTWWRLVAQFLDCEDDTSKLMNFVNAWLAEVWEDRVSDTTEAAVAACVDDDRAQGTVPKEVLVVTGAVDVQGNRLEWSVHGWGLDEESWLIAAGKIDKMADGADWEQLADVMFRNTYGEQALRMRLVVIDSRYRRDEVLDFVRRWPLARMIAGVEKEQPIPMTTNRIDKHPKTGVPLPNAVLVWSVNVGMFKDTVAARIARAVEEPNTTAGRIHLPNDLPESFVTQISSEHKVRERSGSREVMRWVLKPGHQRNEAWDLCVYHAAAAYMVRCHTLRSEARALPTRPTPPPIHEKKRRRPDDRFPRLGGRP